MIHNILLICTGVLLICYVLFNFMGKWRGAWYQYAVPYIALMAFIIEIICIIVSIIIKVRQFIVII